MDFTKYFIQLGPIPATYKGAPNDSLRPDTTVMRRTRIALK